MGSGDASHPSRHNCSMAATAGRITVFFRYDDFSELSPAAVDVPLIAALTRQQVPCAFATVPAITTGSYRDPTPVAVARLGPQKAAMLRSATAVGAVDVALHGLHHRTRGGPGLHSEFVGLDEETQYALLCEGKSVLEGAIERSVVSFVPPWNTYDEATLRALARAGVLGISANRFRPALDAGGLTYLPITTEPARLRAAVEAARGSIAADPVIGVLFHPYDFAESGDARASMSVAAFEKELAWLKGQPDVDIEALSALLAQRERFSVERFRANRPPGAEASFPPWVERTDDILVYSSRAHASASRRSRCWKAALTAMSILVASVAAGGALQALLPNALQQPAIRAAVGGFCALILGLAAFRLWKHGVLHFKAASAALATMGGLTGLLW